MKLKLNAFFKEKKVNFHLKEINRNVFEQMMISYLQKNYLFLRLFERLKIR